MLYMSFFAQQDKRHAGLVGRAMQNHWRRPFSKMHALRSKKRKTNFANILLSAEWNAYISQVFWLEQHLANIKYSRAVRPLRF